MDALADFLEECCVIGPDENVTSSGLYDAYRRWAEGSGERILAKNAFGTKAFLRERGFLKEKRKGARCWFGVGLLGKNLGADDPDAWGNAHDYPPGRERAGGDLALPPMQPLPNDEDFGWTPDDVENT